MKMRYVLDNVHEDNILILENLFKYENFIIKDFRKDKDISFLKEDDCIVWSIASIINNYNLFLNLRQKYICYTLNALTPNVYQNIGFKKNCKGFISSSTENQNMLNSLNLKSFFAPLIYNKLKDKINLNFKCKQISTLINNYKQFAGENTIHNINSYDYFQLVKNNAPNVELYDFSTDQKGSDIEILMNTKYYLHIKYWGHVCNAPLKALALGVPVIMDDITYRLGGYSYYLQSGFNCIILQKPEEIINLINNNIYETLYKNLKTNCINFKNKLTEDYSSAFYSNFKAFLNE